MRNLSLLSLMSVVALASVTSQAVAVIQQTTSDVFHGRKYLWVEAEDFTSLSADPNNEGWIVVDKETPITTALGEEVLPSDSNVSGKALFDEKNADANERHTAHYNLNFISSGRYELYTRYTMFDSDVVTPGDLLNEDSIYLPPAFNKNSSSDWIGFEGLEYDDTISGCDDPDAPTPEDPSCYSPGVGDVGADGWWPLAKTIKSEGVLTDGSDPSFWSGDFYWNRNPVFVDTVAVPCPPCVLPSGEDWIFQDGLGFQTGYDVDPNMDLDPNTPGIDVTFELSTRERYGVIDGLLFIEDDDPNDLMDLLDVFSQEDLDGILSKPGDFDGDNDVDGFDFLELQRGLGTIYDATDLATWEANYPMPGPLSAITAAVPEPASLTLVTMGLAMLAAVKRRRCQCFERRRY